MEYIVKTSRRGLWGKLFPISGRHATGNPRPLVRLPSRPVGEISSSLLFRSSPDYQLHGKKFSLIIVYQSQRRIASSAYHQHLEE